MPETTRKSVYFARRNPALGERFRPRWRRHAALAMSLPPVWDMVDRYAQCDPVEDPPPALGVTHRYDGIGIAWFRSAGAFAAAQGTDAMEAMRRDEMQTFGCLVRDISLRCAETVLKDDGQGLFKVFSLLDRPAGAAPADLARALTEGFASDLIGEPALTARLARLSVCLPDAADGGGRRIDALVEYSFSTLDDAAAFFGADAYAAIAGGYRGLAIEVERCATRELILDDRSLYD